jgi:hypothetical protein
MRYSACSWVVVILVVCLVKRALAKHGGLRKEGGQGKAHLVKNNGPRETSWLNPPWQATDNSNPQVMGLPQWLAKELLTKPQHHLGEFPNGHIVWPALSYDPNKKLDTKSLSAAPPTPKSFGPGFNQNPGGKTSDEIPPPNMPPDMFQIPEPADAPPEWYKNPGQVTPGLPSKPSPPPGTELKKDDGKFMSPHPTAPKGFDAAFDMSK